MNGPLPHKGKCPHTSQYPGKFVFPRQPIRNPAQNEIRNHVNQGKPKARLPNCYAWKQEWYSSKELSSGLQIYWDRLVCRIIITLTSKHDRIIPESIAFRPAQ